MSKTTCEDFPKFKFIYELTWIQPTMMTLRYRHHTRTDDPNHIRWQTLLNAIEYLAVLHGSTHPYVQHVPGHQSANYILLPPNSYQHHRVYSPINPSIYKFREIKTFSVLLLSWQILSEEIQNMFVTLIQFFKWPSCLRLRHMDGPIGRLK